VDKHSEILRAAQHLFGRHGLKKVTTDDIAREARVSKATIYKTYRNKQEILKDVVGHELEELLSRIRAEVEIQDTVKGQLRAHLLTKISTVHQLVNLHSVSRESMAEHWGEAQALREQFVQAEARVLEDILNKGVEAGELEVPNVKATALFMVVSLQALEYPWVIEGLNVSVVEQVDLMLELMMNGLQKRQ